MYVATLLWEIKNLNFLPIFSSYRKMQTNCIFSALILIFLYACNCICWVYLCVFIKILSSSLNTVLIVDKHCSDVCCDEFSVPHIYRKSKQVKEQWHEKLYLEFNMGKLSISYTIKYQNLWTNNEVRGNKNAICLHFLPYLLNICRKYEF